MKKYILSEQQLDFVLSESLKDQKSLSLLNEVHRAFQLDEENDVSPGVERAQRMNKLRGRDFYKAVSKFGAYGSDMIALAQTPEDFYIFINDKGYPSGKGIDLNKLVSGPNRALLMAAYFNGLFGRPEYLYVVEIYSNCSAKVISSDERSVLVIDASNGQKARRGESGKFQVPGPDACSIPPFTPDQAIVSKAEEILLSKQKEEEPEPIPEPEGPTTSIKINTKYKPTGTRVHRPKKARFQEAIFRVKRDLFPKLATLLVKERKLYNTQNNLAQVSIEIGTAILAGDPDMLAKLSTLVTTPEQRADVQTIIDYTED